jgi:hypothetical protein
MWFSTTCFTGERGPRLMISTYRRAGASRILAANNLAARPRNVSCSSLSVAVIAKRTDALRRVRADGGRSNDFELASPTAPVAGYRRADRILVLA